MRGGGGGVLHIPCVKATTCKSEQQRCSCAANKQRSWLLSRVISIQLKEASWSHWLEKWWRGEAVESSCCFRFCAPSICHGQEVGQNHLNSSGPVGRSFSGFWVQSALRAAARLQASHQRILRAWTSMRKGWRRDTEEPYPVRDHRNIVRPVSCGLQLLEKKCPLSGYWRGTSKN